MRQPRQVPSSIKESMLERRTAMKARTLSCASAGHGGVPRMRLAAVGLVAAGAILAGFGVDADRADAAYLAQIKDRVLTIQGDAASDKLAVRLRSGAPEKLQVDVGDDGSADFNFKRDK